MKQLKRFILIISLLLIVCSAKAVVINDWVALTLNAEFGDRWVMGVTTTTGSLGKRIWLMGGYNGCLLYTSDAADE